MKHKTRPLLFRKRMGDEDERRVTPDDETDCSNGGKIITEEFIDLDLPPDHLLWSPDIILQ